MEGMASCTSLSVEIPSETSTASETDDIGRRLLNQYDIDRNGRIDYDELLTIFQDCITTSNYPQFDPVKIRNEYYENFGNNSATPRQQKLAFDIDQLLIFLKNKFGSTIFNNLFHNMNTDTQLSRQVNIRRTLTGGSSALSRSASSSATSNGNSLILCNVCYEPSVARDVYGHPDFPYPRNCTSCDVNICILCLEKNSLTQISAGQKMTCPGYDEHKKLCGRTLKQQLTNIFFKNTCTICRDSLSSSCASVGCAFDHQFCSSCLKSYVFTKLQQKTELLCPRYAQCKFVLDEESLSNMFEESEERKRVLIAWRDSKMTNIINRHELMKRCKTADCNGHIRGHIDMTKYSEVRCSDCNISRCFDCCDYYHQGRTCAQVARLKVIWDKFLVQLAGKYPDIDLSDAISAIEANALNLAYFNEKINEGMLRKCPGCSRIIQKTLNSCSAVVCGEDTHGGNRQAGCNLHFDWNNAPIVTIDEYMGDNMRNILVGDITELNLCDLQVDLSVGVSDSNQITLIGCSACRQPIRGTRFDCVYCYKSSICFKCMGDAVKRSGRLHRNHHFEIINPLKKPDCNLKLLQCCLTPAGAIQVYNIAHCRTTPAPPPKVGPGRIETPVKYCAVRIDVLPNGNIVFADDFGRAFRCLVLENIVFPLQGTNSDALALLSEIVTSSTPPMVYKNGVTALIQGEVTVTGTPSTQSAPYPLATHLDGCEITLKSSYCNDLIGMNSLQENRQIHFPQVAIPRENQEQNPGINKNAQTISTAYHQEHLVHRNVNTNTAARTRCSVCNITPAAAITYHCVGCSFNVCLPCLWQEQDPAILTFDRWVVSYATSTPSTIGINNLVSLSLIVSYAPTKPFTLLCSKNVIGGFRELYLCEASYYSVKFDEDVFMLEVSSSNTSRVRLKSVKYNQYVCAYRDRGKCKLGLWTGGDDEAVIQQQYFEYEIKDNIFFHRNPHAANIDLAITPSDVVGNVTTDAAPNGNTIFLGALAADNTLHLNLNYLSKSAANGVDILVRDGYEDVASCPIRMFQCGNIRHLTGSLMLDTLLFSYGFSPNSELLHLPASESHDYWGHFIVMIDSGFDGSNLVGAAVVSLEGDVLKFLCYTQETIDQYGEDMLPQFRRMVLDIHYSTQREAFDIILPKGVVTPPQSKNIMKPPPPRNLRGGRGRGGRGRGGRGGGFCGLGMQMQQRHGFGAFGEPIAQGQGAFGGFGNNQGGFGNPIPPLFGYPYQPTFTPAGTAVTTETDTSKYRSAAYTDGNLCYLSGIVEKVSTYSTEKDGCIWNKGDIIGKLPEGFYPKSKLSFVTIAEGVNWQGLEAQSQNTSTNRNQYRPNNANEFGDFDFRPPFAGGIQVGRNGGGQDD